MSPYTTLCGLPAELKLMIVEELKTDHLHTGFGLIAIWPELRDAIIACLWQNTYGINGLDEHVHGNIDRFFAAIAKFPIIATTTTTFFLRKLYSRAPGASNIGFRFLSVFDSLSHLRVLMFHCVDLDILDKDLLKNVFSSISNLREINVATCRIDLIHLFIMLNVANLESVSLAILHIVDFDALNPNFDLYSHPDIVEFGPDTCRFDGQFRTGKLDLQLVSKDDCILLDLLASTSVFVAQPIIADLRIFSVRVLTKTSSRRVSRLLERTSSSLSSLSFQECPSSFERTTIPPISVSHLTNLHLHSLIHNASPTNTIQWFADILSEVPMRSKLEHITLGIVMMGYDRTRSSLPTQTRDAHPMWKALDEALANDKLDLDSFKLQVSMQDTEEGSAESFGLDKWILAVCLPAIRDKYYPGVTFQESDLGKTQTDSGEAED